jgi:hypothetical protein
MITKFEEFFKDCDKNLPVSEDILLNLPENLPESYIEFLSFSDGIEGGVSNGSYLQLWKAEELKKLNELYKVEEFIPGMLLIGTDGGDNAIGIDLRENSSTFGNFFKVSFIPLIWNEAILLGSDVTDINLI